MISKSYVLLDAWKKKKTTKFKKWRTFIDCIFFFKFNVISVPLLWDEKKFKNQKSIGKINVERWKNRPLPIWYSVSYTIKKKMAYNLLTELLLQSSDWIIYVLYFFEIVAYYRIVFKVKSNLKNKSQTTIRACRIIGIL